MQYSPVLLCITLFIGGAYSLFGRLKLLSRITVIVMAFASLWCMLPAVGYFSNEYPMVTLPRRVQLWQDVYFEYTLDGISIIFMIMTSLIIPISVFASSDAMKKNTRLYIFLFFSLELFLMLTFLASNLLVFYFFFEYAWFADPRSRSDSNGDHWM